ncbi:histone acetyltransferase [Plasmodiophora brassicae]|uniref:Histone acetyltransferase n=1 Tax=Plasmodiophora brassicae TaxID=37360 RepID=A0A0G4J755_PLABS|nr:hypothetical protein PBRA_003175 [Plasmodiophora brassicae]SPQ95648.1 unnamed protein product [Plasmodiophora brassicae]
MGGNRDRDRDRKRNSTGGTSASRKASGRRSSEKGDGGGGAAVSRKRPRESSSKTRGDASEDEIDGVVAASPSAPPVAPVVNPLFYDHRDPTALIPIGYKLYAKSKDGKYRPCEILESKMVMQNHPNEEDDSDQKHSHMYYIHYLQFDRRMDRWCTRDELAVEAELPEPPDMTLEVAIQASLHHAEHSGYSPEEHRAHEEATRVKNVNSIVLGKYEIEAWYFSPFPEEYSRFGRLLFCEFCLSYFGYQCELDRHSRRCTLRHPPGSEIYRSEEQNVRLSVFEVDGAKEVTYCQNICLIAKLFLDHKTLQYDTEAFLFYIVCEVDDIGCHITGYFSKEKEPEQENNLACILTLPCHQRKGYGKFLISLSYELSKIERRAGSPEKPLSDLGRVSYESYWAQELLRVLKDKAEQDVHMSIEDLSRVTAILPGDIKATLERLNVIRYESGEHIIKIPRSLIEQHLKKKKIDASRVHVRPCQPEKLHFAPFILTKGRRVLR